MNHPTRIATVHVETLGDELCIYDWQRKEVHALNPTAARVWQLCDGQTSLPQIAATLQAELNLPDAEDLVWLTLSQLERAHLLAEAVVKPARRKVLPRREFLRMGVGVALLPLIHSIVAPPPVAAQSPVPTATPTATATAAPTATATATVTPTATPVPGSQTFNFTGAEQQFTVPTGVTSVTIEAFGAEGGREGPPKVSIGGQGGRTVATIAVTAGETLFVYVGGRGGDKLDTNVGAGGFNGGGAGNTGSIPSFNSPGGGGASDVRQGGSGLANRVVVAGGGGATGVRTSNSESGNGGNGGGLTGAQGEGGYQLALNSGASGGGGTQSSGGAGGLGGGGNPTGANGSSGNGGVGGGTGSSTALAGGGGGGGGYFGGGGGGTSGTAPNDGESGSGGGGSSFVIPSATNVTLQQGGRLGNGQVIISWP